MVNNKGRVYEDGQLMDLEKSRLNGVCNMRRSLLTELGWDPEWEVNPSEVKLLDKIGGGEGGGGGERGNLPGAGRGFHGLMSLH